MNILILTTHFNVGGITSYILTLAKGLKQEGHKVFVASSGGGQVVQLENAGISHFYIPINTKQEISLKVLKSYFEVSKFIKEKGIDIIHSHTRVTQVLGCLLAARLKKAYISTCHGFFKPRAFRKLFPCWGDRVIAISAQVKKHLTDDFKIKEGNISVINNGIDVKWFSERTIATKTSLKTRLGLKSAPVIGIVARLSDVKGHIFLIEAMKLVLEKYPDAQLLIVGEGPMKKDLTVMVERLKLKEKVFFLPNTSDTRSVLSAMDIFVMPSLIEGLGLSLMEAMACGLAVIGSDVGGIRSLIQDKSNGLLVPPKDPQALGSAIVELLSSFPKTKLLGDNAKVFIERNFPQEQMVKKTEGVYLACLKQRSA